MQVSDLFLEYTPVNGKPSHIRLHRVWDRDRFIASQIEAHTGPKIEANDRVIVSVSNAEAYREQQRAGSRSL